MKPKNRLPKLLLTFFLVLSLPFQIILVQKAVKYLPKAFGKPANLVVEMTIDYGKSSDAWKNLAQGGEDPGRMFLPIISEVGSLKPDYIRIDHVFDFYEPLLDNFEKLDQILGDIKAMGAKPFISLSYLPNNLAQNGDITSLPSDWSLWEQLVQKTVEHISGKDKLGITDVYYEVWNEPDLFGNYKISGEKNYLDLYLHSANGASRAINTLPYKLGGPATTGYYENWMKNLVNYALKNNLRLDFLSWHRYSKNLDDYLSDVSKVKVYGKEAIISEMGFTGENDPDYDTDFGAIHEIAVSTVLQNEVEKTFTFEIKDGSLSNKKYWGRWGLFTNEKFGTPEPKPRAKAFSFLNTMTGGSTLNVMGQGSWVKAFAKKISDKTIRLLVVNYDPAGTHVEAVPIRLKNLSSQNFTFKRTDFLGTSSSQEVAATSAEWETSQYFKPNSAAIFEITTK